MMRPLALLLLTAILAANPPAAAQVSLRAFGAEGGDFRAELSDGRVLRGADLVGATIRLEVDGQPLNLRIDAAEREQDPVAPDVWLFTLAQETADGGWENHCLPDPKGQRFAIPYAGPHGALMLTCSAGAVGKCLRAGYRPWAVAPDGRTSLAPYHAACVNMMRGAYGGPDQPWTRNGMLIDLYDRIGVQQPTDDPALAFEAGWTADGAVCLAHPRVPENGSLSEIEAATPRMRDRTGADRCTEATAAGWGALLFNRSRPPAEAR